MADRGHPHTGRCRSTRAIRAQSLTGTVLATRQGVMRSSRMGECGLRSIESPHKAGMLARWTMREGR